MEPTIVDPSYASWLKADRLTHAAVPSSASRWPMQGATASGLSPFAGITGATAEGERRAAFFQAPLVRDRVVVDGEARALIGRCIEISCGLLDYAPIESVFVVKVDEQANGTSILTVLRRVA